MLARSVVEKNRMGAFALGEHLLRDVEDLVGVDRQETLAVGIRRSITDVMIMGW
jgi:hypothetical protein